MYDRETETGVQFPKADQKPALIPWDTGGAAVAHRGAVVMRSCRAARKTLRANGPVRHGK